MKAAFLSRRDLMIDGLSAIPGLKVNRPMGAFYLFPDVSALFGKSNGNRTIENAEDFAMYLLEEAHVATVGGGAFGTPECIRLSYAASEAQLNEALARISKAVAALQ
jgi:aspartate aminotransferase